MRPFVQLQNINVVLRVESELEADISPKLINCEEMFFESLLCLVAETNVKPGSSHKGETGETGASPETEPGKAAETVTQQDTESPGRAEEGAGTPEEKAKKDEASSTPEGDLLDATDKEAVDAFEKGECHFARIKQE